MNSANICLIRVINKKNSRAAWAVLGDGMRAKASIGGGKKRQDLIFGAEGGYYKYAIG